MSNRKFERFVSLKIFISIWKCQEFQQQSFKIEQKLVGKIFRNCNLRNRRKISVEFFVLKQVTNFYLVSEVGIKISTGFWQLYFMSPKETFSGDCSGENKLPVYFFGIGMEKEENNWKLLAALSNLLSTSREDLFAFWQKNRFFLVVLGESDSESPHSTNCFRLRANSLKQGILHCLPDVKRNFRGSYLVEKMNIS